MKFVVRVDDIGITATESKEPDYGLQLAQRFHAAMQGLPYLAAVVPAHLTRGAVKWLSSQPKGMTLALHGWDHSRVDSVDSEFHGKTFDECRKLINDGRLKLVGKDKTIPHLVPPFNAIEPELPEAAYQEGVRYIWGAPSSWWTPPQPHRMGSVTFVPSWKPLYAATLWKMSSDTPSLETTLPLVATLPGCAVLTLHITWEAAHHDDFRGVDWLVGLIKDSVITPEEFLS